MVLALAGRRVDSLEAQLPSFPQQNIDLVRQRILSLFEQSNVTVLVCSAACGADLLALEAANTLGRRRRIVIPFNPDRFRESSVADRPGDWVTSFERFVHQAEINGDLVNLRLPETDESYLRT